MQTPLAEVRATEVNTILLVIGVPILAWLARSVSKLDRAVASLSQTLVGAKEAPGLVAGVGRLRDIIDSITVRLDKAESAIDVSVKQHADYESRLRALEKERTH